MKNVIFLSSIFLLFISCNSGNRTKVIYPKNGDETKTELKKDTTLIDIADIPMYIDSTAYLIHPVGSYKIYGTGSRKNVFGSYSGSGGSFSVSGYRRDEISGNLHNLKFQHLDSDVLKPLTDQIVQIQSITFLRDVFNTNKKQYLVYKILDEDTNGDHKLNGDDVETLYMSKIDGTSFTKLTGAYHELIDFKVIPVNNRLYFRSMEDTNKDGKFDKEDTVLYQYVDFNSDVLEVTSYNPL